MKIKVIQHGLLWCGVATLLVLGAPLSKASPQTAETKQTMKDNLHKALSEMNLSEDQKTKVKSIFADSKTKREAIVKDTTLTEDQKQDKLKELRGSTRSQINEVLTPDQRSELAEKLKGAAAKPQ